MKDAMDKYNEITYKIPPIVTAAAVPVVAVSLLAKTLTGHGLPGTLLGAIEGVSWLVLPLGLGSLAPRLGDVGKAGDFGEVVKILTQEGRAYEGFGEDSRGKNATERLASITSKVDPNSPLGQQMADIAKRKAELGGDPRAEGGARKAARGARRGGARAGQDHLLGLGEGGGREGAGRAARSSRSRRRSRSP